MHSRPPRQSEWSLLQFNIAIAVAGAWGTTPRTLHLDCVRLTGGTVQDSPFTASHARGTHNWRSMSPDKRGHKRCINLTANRESNEDRQLSGVHVEREAGMRALVRARYCDCYRGPRTSPRARAKVCTQASLFEHDGFRFEPPYVNHSHAPCTKNFSDSTSDKHY